MNTVYIDGSIERVLVATWSSDDEFRSLWRNGLSRGRYGTQFMISTRRVIGNTVDTTDSYAVVYDDGSVQCGLNPDLPYFRWALTVLGLWATPGGWSSALRGWLEVPPVPGTFVFSEAEMEVFDLLGENPLTWPDDELAEWASALWPPDEDNSF